MAAIFQTTFFKGIFLNQNIYILIQISLKFVPKGPINNIPALVQIMARRRPGAIIWTNDGMVYWRIYASLGLNELTWDLEVMMVYVVIWSWYLNVPKTNI